MIKIWHQISDHTSICFIYSCSTAFDKQHRIPCSVFLAPLVSQELALSQLCHYCCASRSVRRTTSLTGPCLLDESSHCSVSHECSALVIKTTYNLQKHGLQWQTAHLFTIIINFRYLYFSFVNL